MTELDDHRDPGTGITDEAAFVAGVRAEAYQLARTGNQLELAYRITKGVTFVGLAVVAVLAAARTPYWSLATAAGAVIVCEGWSLLNRYYEGSLRRRAVADALYAELDLYRAQVQDYVGQNRFRRLVERVTRLRGDFSRSQADSAGTNRRAGGYQTRQRPAAYPEPETERFSGTESATNTAG